MGTCLANGDKEAASAVIVRRDGHKVTQCADDDIGPQRLGSVNGRIVVVLEQLKSWSTLPN